jgi:peptidoglycan L-alanyl-D-glutamate endopeptidase CwlK
MPSFGSKSKAALAKCHPLLQDIANEAIKEIDFMVLDATRGRVAQERAFAGGQSKARFGQSAHNYVPAIAFDLFPAPYDWNNTASFIALSKVIMRIAAEKKIPLRWGGDWNSDGSKTTSDAWDKPHYELNPWREWAKKSKLFEG